MFDVNNFLNQSVTGPLSTRIPVVPVGDYRAVISKLDVPPPVKTKNGESHILRVTWKLIDAAELAAIDREVATVRQDIWLELDDTGQLEASEGKNVSLGRLLETLGLNDSGTQIGQLMGQVAIIKVGHRAGKDPSDVYDEVTRVASLT